LNDPSYNIRLGTAYLARGIESFGGSYVLAAAAYNAGPGRATQWVARNGDPRIEGVDVVDWIERIPFDETRNYVQRVMENLMVYRWRLHPSAPAASLEADLRRRRAVLPPLPGGDEAPPETPAETPADQRAPEGDRARTP
jgi:soluble lytic murein transglycosylase